MLLRVGARRGVSFGAVGTPSPPVGLILGASSAALLLLGAGAGHAAEPVGPEGTRFRLAYVAPASCPDRSAFLAAIHMRTRRPQLAAEGEPALTFAVSIEPRQGSTVGRLEVRDPDAASTGVAPQKRTVSSGTCGEVAKALALVVALILDPDAETSADPEPPPVDEGSPAGDEPAAITSVPEVVPARRRRHERPRPTPPVRRPVELSGGAALGISGAIGPAVAPGAEIFAELAFTSGDRPGRAVVFDPAIRLGAASSVTSSDLALGSHRYWWAGATVRACPLHVRLPGALRLAPCGGMHLGVHHGSTEGVPNGTASTDLWVAPVAGASIEWPLTSSVGLELHGGAVFPLVRTRFFLAPDTTIFEVPAVAGTTTIAARLRFW